MTTWSVRGRTLPPTPRPQAHGPTASLALSRAPGPRAGWRLDLFPPDSPGAGACPLCSESAVHACGCCRVKSSALGGPPGELLWAESFHRWGHKAKRKQQWGGGQRASGFKPSVHPAAGALLTGSSPRCHVLCRGGFLTRLRGWLGGNMPVSQV